VATKAVAWSPQTDSILAFAITLEQLPLVVAPLATPLCPEQKDMGAHQIQSTTCTALEEHTEGALSKALSVAGFDGSWSQTLTAYSDYSGHNKAKFQVLVAEADTSIVTQSRAATSFLQTTWL